MSAYSAIVSLGGNCEVAYQIRRRFGVERAFPFDWWITPLDAVPMLFSAGPDLLFQDGRLDPGPHRHAVRCQVTGILHHHDFDRDAEGLVVAEAVGSQTPGLKGKYAALWSRLDEACGAGGRVLFVRSWCAILHYPDTAPRQDPAGGYDFQAVLSAIGERYPRLDFEVMFVNYGPRTSPDPRAAFVDVDYSGEPCDWRGSDSGWDAVFAGVSLKPVAAAALPVQAEGLVTA